MTVVLAAPPALSSALEHFNGFARLLKKNDWMVGDERGHSSNKEKRVAALNCEFTLAIAYTPAELKSVSQISHTKGDRALAENEPITLPRTQIRRLGKGRPVREMK